MMEGCVRTSFRLSLYEWTQPSGALPMHGPRHKKHEPGTTFAAMQHVIWQAALLANHTSTNYYLFIIL